MDDKKKLYGIYHPLTNELIYVGVTNRSIKTRLKEHLRKPTNNLMSEWFSEIKESGLEPTIKTISEYTTYEEALLNETKMIKSKDSLLNKLVDGIKSYMLGKKHTEKTKKLISKRLSGRVMSKEELDNRRKIFNKLWSDPEWSENIKSKFSKNMIGNQRALGFKHTEEFKKRKKLSMLGNSYSSGNKHTEEYKKYMSEINRGTLNPNFGKNPSKKSINNRIKKVKQEGIFKGENNPNFKYVINKEELIKYLNDGLTVKNISEIYGCTPPVIRNKIKNYALKLPKKNKYKLDIKCIKKYLENGMNMKEIGTIYGCNNKIISKYIKKHG